MVKECEVSSGEGMTMGRPPLYEDKRKEVLALLAKGYSMRWIEAKLSVPRSIIGRMAKK